MYIHFWSPLADHLDFLCAGPPVKPAWDLRRVTDPGETLTEEDEEDWGTAAAFGEGGGISLESRLVQYLS